MELITANEVTLDELESENGSILPDRDEMVTLFAGLTAGLVAAVGPAVVAAGLNVQLYAAH
jgi:hypothetical protein